MLLCPDCRFHLPMDHFHSCGVCGWKGEKHGEVLQMFATKDRENEGFQRYLANYDKICAEDLSGLMQHQSYLDHQATKTMEYLAGEIAGRKVCEIGVGKGGLLRKLAAAEPAELTAVDVSLGYLDALADIPDLRRVQASAEYLPFLEEFDWLIACDVLEHVMNVGSALFAINKAVVPGGRVLIRIPYNDFIVGSSPHVGCGYEFTHLRGYDRTLLSSHLRQAGFEVLSHHYDGFHARHAHSFFAESAIGDWLFTKIVRDKHSYWDVASLPSDHGRFFMRPTELAVVARKVIDLNVAEPHFQRMMFDAGLSNRW